MYLSEIGIENCPIKFQYLSQMVNNRKFQIISRKVVEELRNKQESQRQINEHQYKINGNQQSVRCRRPPGNPWILPVTSLERAVAMRSRARAGRVLEDPARVLGSSWENPSWETLGRVLGASWEI